MCVRPSGRVRGAVIDFCHLGNYCNWVCVCVRVCVHVCYLLREDTEETTNQIQMNRRHYQQSERETAERERGVCVCER